ncbi:hypothetical protein PFISCL1PPCAC_17161, partial [Pristionchus fissidentatus]
DLHQTPSGFVSSLVNVSVSVLFPPSSFLIFIILLRLPPVHSAAQCFFSFLLKHIPPVRSAAQCFFSFSLKYDLGSVVGMQASLFGLSSASLFSLLLASFDRVTLTISLNSCVFPQQKKLTLTVSLLLSLRTFPSLIAWSSSAV